MFDYSPCPTICVVLQQSSSSSLDIVRGSGTFDRTDSASDLPADGPTGDTAIMHVAVVTYMFSCCPAHLMLSFVDMYMSVCC